MPATLRGLLSHSDFNLKVIAGVDDPAILSEPLTWAHSSDLADPTAWLEPGQLLLTDGMQFVDDDSVATTDPYILQLKAHGIMALGFSVDVAHAAVPQSLVAACNFYQLPLLEVPARTPFISIIRYVADIISKGRHERLEWSVRAHRAVSRAALRPDGLGSVVAELERQLGCWVALFDAVGDRVHVATRLTIPEHIEASILDAVHQSLAREVRAGMRLNFDGTGATLQTLGQSDRLRGVLAVGAVTPLDAAGADLVANVVGMASIALEQRGSLLQTRLRLRAGVMELLLSGVDDVAGETAQRLWGKLPTAPIYVAVLAWPRQGHALVEELELHSERLRGRLFFAERDEEIVIVVQPEDIAALETLLTRHAMGAGFSGQVVWDELSHAVDEARKAAARAETDRPFVRFETLAQEGMLGFLDASGAQDVARRMLQPLLATDVSDGYVLLTSAATWLEYNGAWDPAARALHIHRHTLRKRIEAVERTLGIDLSLFNNRAELWAALQFVDRQ